MNNDKLTVQGSGERELREYFERKAKRYPDDPNAQRRLALFSALLVSLARSEAALKRLASGEAIAGVPLWFHAEDNASPKTQLWHELQARRDLAESALAG